MRWNELRLSPLRMQKLSFLAEIYHILTPLCYSQTRYKHYNGKVIKRDGKKYNNYLYADYTKNSRNQRTIGTYYEYIPEIESVACMLCSIDTRIPLKQIPLKWRIDEVFFLGEIEKSEVLKAFGANIFFDDQTVHTEPASKLVPSARVPYKQNGS